jgi:hypothetical protein
MRLTARSALWVGAGVVIIVAATFVVRRLGHRPAAAPTTAWTPLPHRVRVEVRNASNLSGAARTGRLLLQHAGLDVVQSGNADSAITANRILVRMGDTTGVGRIVEALGGADVVTEPDSSRLVDLTVILGRNFAPPPDRFNASQSPRSQDP